MEELRERGEEPALTTQVGKMEIQILRINRRRRRRRRRRCRRRRRRRRSTPSSLSPTGETLLAYPM
jgi:hypothetical protein